MVQRSFEAVCIKPTSPLHFGEKGIGIEEVTCCPHSDTIFSALCLSYLQLYGQGALEGLLYRFIEGKPPFLISSAFPYYGGMSPRIFFYPKPHMPIGLNQENGSIEKLRKASFLSKTVFENCLVGGIDRVLKDLQNGEAQLRGDLIVSKSESETVFKDKEPRLYRSLRIPRNRLHRTKISSEPYYAGATVYYQDSGIYFLLDVREKGEYDDKIIHCLNLLRDEGVGGERTLGYGRFDYALEKLDILEADDAYAFLSLSLYHPTLDEVKEFIANGECWSYRLVTRGGFVQSPLLRRVMLKGSVRMMMEGSVFPRIEGKNLYGDFPRVLKEEQNGAHAVYRYGYAFPLAVRV